MSNRPQINIVIPLYNEDQVFSELRRRLINLIDSSSLKIEVILVDDGSNDCTTELMESLLKIRRSIPKVIGDDLQQSTINNYRGDLRQLSSLSFF